MLVCQKSASLQPWHSNLESTTSIRKKQTNGVSRLFSYCKLSCGLNKNLTPFNKEQWPERRGIFIFFSSSCLLSIFCFCFQETYSTEGISFNSCRHISKLLTKTRRTLCCSDTSSIFLDLYDKAVHAYIRYRACVAML